jgi:hypothetical protein
MVVENDIELEMKTCWYQQTEFKKLMFRQIMLHKSDMNALEATLDDLSHATKHLSKHLDMVQVQCDQIDKAHALILSQKGFSKAISTNVITRRGTETQEPAGPAWYQEEQARKAKELERMSHEETDIVDPQDDVDYEEQRKKRKKPREEKVLKIKTRYMILTQRQ